MTVILMDRISKLILVAVDILRPVITVFSSIYPAFVCLGFNNEDTIYGDNYVVNLCGVSIIGDKEIVDDLVFIFREFLEDMRYALFTDCSFGW